MIIRYQAYTEDSLVIFDLHHDDDLLLYLPKNVSEKSKLKKLITNRMNSNLYHPSHNGVPWYTYQDVTVLEILDKDIMNKKGAFW